MESVSYINDNLVGYMNTMSKVNPDTYEATTITLGTLIDKNNEVTKRRNNTNVDPTPEN